MYALQIERVYTKEQIMTLYCNQIFLVAERMESRRLRTTTSANPSRT
jgi:hypothetical protein